MFGGQHFSHMQFSILVELLSNWEKHGRSQEPRKGAAYSARSACRVRKDFYKEVASKMFGGIKHNQINVNY